MKKLLRLFIVFQIILTVITAVGNVSKSYAFSSVLGAKVVIEESTIDGVKIESPRKEILIISKNPTFSGYTIPNSKLTLIIRSMPIYRNILSDANGFWKYTLDIPLASGRHTLSMKISDRYGNTSDEILIATFRIPQFPTSQPQIQQINYFSITLIVLGALFFLGIIYAVLHKKT